MRAHPLPTRPQPLAESRLQHLRSRASAAIRAYNHTPDLPLHFPPPTPTPRVCDCAIRPSSPPAPSRRRLPAPRCTRTRRSRAWGRRWRATARPCEGPVCVGGGVSVWVWVLALNSAGTQSMRPPMQHMHTARTVNTHCSLSTHTAHTYTRNARIQHTAHTHTHTSTSSLPSSVATHMHTAHTHAHTSTSSLPSSVATKSFSFLLPAASCTAAATRTARSSRSATRAKSDSVNPRVVRAGCGGEGESERA